VKATIHQTATARRDLLQIWAYIAVDNLTAADNLLDLIDEKIQLLAESPGLGPRRPELGRSLRSFPVGHYIIFYRRRRDGILLVRVLHGARNLRRVFRRRNT
jgi:toxin ParE1/3/4